MLPLFVDSIVVVTTLLVGFGGALVVVPSLVVGDGSVVVGLAWLLLVELAGGGGSDVCEVAGGCVVGVVGSEVGGFDVGVDSWEDGGGVVSAVVCFVLDGGASVLGDGSEEGEGAVVDSAGAGVAGLEGVLSAVGVVSAAAVVVPVSAALPVTEVASVVGEVSEAAVGVLGVVGSAVGGVSEVVGAAGVAGAELAGSAVSGGAVVSAAMSVLVELDAIVNCLATFTGPDCLRAGAMLANRIGERPRLVGKREDGEPKRAAEARQLNGTTSDGAEAPVARAKVTATERRRCDGSKRRLHAVCSLQR